MALPTADCPILVWLLTLNREYTLDEYNACNRVVSTCVKYEKVPHRPEDPNSFRKLITMMLPLLMMRHRRIPRSKWRDCQTQNGKHWIEQIPPRSQAQDDMTPERFMNSMIGYHLSWSNSLCMMAMCQGTQRRVVNIGAASKQLAVEPRGATISAYIDSQSHKLTQLEIDTIKESPSEEAQLRRLCMILTLKQAYIKAIGQPIGFDYSRLEFNMPEKKASADNHPLTGWEFRIWQANLGVARKNKLVKEDYQCACAFFRGTMDSTFLFYESTEQLNTWVQFLNIDQMVKIIPKLTS